MKVTLTTEESFIAEMKDNKLKNVYLSSNVQALKEDEKTFVVGILTMQTMTEKNLYSFSIQYTKEVKEGEDVDTIFETMEEYVEQEKDKHATQALQDFNIRQGAIEYV